MNPFLYILLNSIICTRYRRIGLHHIERLLHVHFFPGISTFLPTSVQYSLLKTVCTNARVGCEVGDITKTCQNINSVIIFKHKLQHRQNWTFSISLDLLQDFPMTALFMHRKSVSSPVLDVLVRCPVSQMHHKTSLLVFGQPPCNSHGLSNGACAVSIWYDT